MIVDFHTHILPGMDDGSPNTETSIQMLQTLLKDGVDICLATSHFYCESDTVVEFLEKREAALNLLLKEVWNTKIPLIKLGAEVLYSPVLKKLPNLKDLCIEGTDYLLLELPYAKITPTIVSDIEEIIETYQITPIIAHAERYLRFTSYESLVNVLELDVLSQVNCDSLLRFGSRRNACRLITEGYIHLLGSDAHNMSSRPPRMKEAFKYICSKFGRDYLDTLMHNSTQVLRNTSIYDIL
ncbi:MAG: hypothetical protein IJD02_00840 [Lachnospiraceae bacterium]|nr:hypothetical protein [Lachnospiraceae bacterium]